MGNDFAGWGNSYNITDLVESPKVHSLDHEQKSFLSEWPSTALCGNDITSSCLYVSSLALIHAGILAPVVLILVGLTLYLFRKIYAEVGGALPLNGGTYTLLLNTTSKKMAATAACLTILSYIATAVISANEAIHYLRVLFHGISPEIGVILLLSFFAFLTFWGIGESAKVALGIFIIHIVTITLLIISCIYFIIFQPEILIENFRYGWQNLNVAKSLFFGFSVALLGISGFESSANFIEEQAEGVFPKTLKNMWLAVFILNPVIAFMSLGVVRLDQVTALGEGFLSNIGGKTVGTYFAFWISINAFLVLSGAVLTSFVGVSGLVRRMTLDRCLPSFLLKENQARKTNHWIILFFLLVCLSIFFMTEGKTTDLAGVYTLSFLLVMTFFAVGNILLKVKRAKLPRSERAPWAYLFMAIIIMICGIVGNVMLNSHGTFIFLGYFAVVVGLVLFFLLKRELVKFTLEAVQTSPVENAKAKGSILNFLKSLSWKLSSDRIVYFSKGDNLRSLNQAALYVLKNEQTMHLMVCHVYEDQSALPKDLDQYIKFIDQVYPSLKIDLVFIKGKFTPNMIESISNKMKVPKNMMFIGSPGGQFPHRIERLGGVRVILS